ncbi:unnamed protein product [Citrullus colocynthis]|uniref:Uncharacterized protein n=1 Tax=Citrullus colocynthis TaxID=252529 RepID=A0ABP0Y4B1_9ROSI
MGVEIISGSRALSVRLRHPRGGANEAIGCSSPRLKTRGMLGVVGGRCAEEAVLGELDTQSVCE